jgi:hypothetical protein
MLPAASPTAGEDAATRNAGTRQGPALGSRCPVGDADAEEARAAALLAAEARAVELFADVERRGLIAAGRRDREVSDLIRDLAHEMSHRCDRATSGAVASQSARISTREPSR